MYRDQMLEGNLKAKQFGAFILNHICRHYKDSKSVLRWRRSKCINGVVEAHHEGLVS